MFLVILYLDLVGVVRHHDQTLQRSQWKQQQNTPATAGHARVQRGVWICPVLTVLHCYVGKRCNVFYWNTKTFDIDCSDGSNGYGGVRMLVSTLYQHLYTQLWNLVWSCMNAEQSVLLIARWSHRATRGVHTGHSSWNLKKHRSWEKPVKTCFFQ